MPFIAHRALRIATAAAAATALLACATAADATAVYDNLAASQDGSDPLFSYGPLGDSFATGVNGGALGNVSVLLGNDSASVVGTLEVGLYADAGDAPGAELVSLGSLSSASVSTAGFGSYVFSPTSSFTLAADTTYWVVIQSTSPNGIEWSWSNDTSALGVAGQSSYSAELGTSANSDFGPYQMAVDVSAVPEPASLWMSLLGLGALAGTAARRARRQLPR